MKRRTCFTEIFCPRADKHWTIISSSLIFFSFSVLKCPQLEAPKNGYFVNDRCKSVFNAACGLRCKPGYELQGSGLRICREDGTWSGTDTQCISKL